jgi:hypothetical protein
LNALVEVSAREELLTEASGFERCYAQKVLGAAPSLEMNDAKERA